MVTGLYSLHSTSPYSASSSLPLVIWNAFFWPRISAYLHSSQKKIEYPRSIYK